MANVMLFRVAKLTNCYRDFHKYDVTFTQMTNEFTQTTNTQDRGITSSGVASKKILVMP